MAPADTLRVLEETQDKNLLDYFKTNIHEIPECTLGDVTKVIAGKETVVLKDVRKFLIDQVSQQFDVYKNQTPINRRDRNNINICNDIYTLASSLVHNKRYRFWTKSSK